MTRIWFNHWFSAVYHIIGLIREGDPGRFFVIGSGTNPAAVYRAVCDAWFDEPAEIGAEAYVDDCLTFCREQGVELFAPRRHLTAIAENAARFEAIGVRLLADPNAALHRMLDDKAATYAFFAQTAPEWVPDYRVAHSEAEFSSACEALGEKHARLCYKLVTDEGARSFRVIDARIETAQALLEKPGAKITLAAARKVLSGYDFAVPVLVMPYLAGPEISADCLATPRGNLVIPRYKSGKRYSEVILFPEVQDACDRIIALLGLTMPLNIQFRVDGGRLYLLEINPRMSGGLQLSCKATGINLPDIAVQQLLGVERPWAWPALAARKVAHIETPICLP